MDRFEGMFVFTVDLLDDSGIEKSVETVGEDVVGQRLERLALRFCRIVHLVRFSLDFVKIISTEGQCYFSRVEKYILTCKKIFRF